MELSLKEAATLMGRSERTLRGQLARGEIVGTRRLGRWAYGVGEEQLEEHYRKRSLLQRNVLPEDVAEAVAFFASDLSAKSTGNILNVDAGNVTAFPR